MPIGNLWRKIMQPCASLGGHKATLSYFLSPAAQQLQQMMMIVIYYYFGPA